VLRKDGSTITTYDDRGDVKAEFGPAFLVEMQLILKLFFQFFFVSSLPIRIDFMY
jgi:hypothetical protein